MLKEWMTSTPKNGNKLASTWKKEEGITAKNMENWSKERKKEKRNETFKMTEVTSTPTRPVDNVVIATKGLQDRNIYIITGTTVENKGKLILTEIFPSVQKHDIF